jgi:hypothetical protein
MTTTVSLIKISLDTGAYKTWDYDFGYECMVLGLWAVKEMGTGEKPQIFFGCKSKRKFYIFTTNADCSNVTTVNYQELRYLLPESAPKSPNVVNTYALYVDLTKRQGAIGYFSETNTMLVQNIDLVGGSILGSPATVVKNAINGGFIDSQYSFVLSQDADKTKTFVNIVDGVNNTAVANYTVGPGVTQVGVGSYNKNMPGGVGALLLVDATGSVKLSTI